MSLSKRVTSQRLPPLSLALGLAHFLSAGQTNDSAPPLSKGVLVRGSVPYVQADGHSTDLELIDDKPGSSAGRLKHTALLTDQPDAESLSTTKHHLLR